MNIIVTNASLNIIDTNGIMPIISQAQLDVHDSDIFDFIYKHSIKILEDTSLKNAIFTSNCFNSILEGRDFLEQSSIIANRLYDIMTKQPAIPMADLLVCTMTIEDVPHLALLKLNYKIGFTHYVNGQSVQLIKHQTILPSEGQKIDEAAFINLIDLSVKVLERKYEIDGENREYFSEIFLECDTERSKKEVMKVISSVTKKVTKEIGDVDFKVSAKLKETMHEMAERNEFVDIEELANTVFLGSEASKITYISELKKAGVEPRIQLDEDELPKLIKSHKFKTDKGIELKLPIKLWEDKSAIEFINNPDGTVSILIKNITNLK